MSKYMIPIDRMCFYKNGSKLSLIINVAFLDWSFLFILQWEKSGSTFFFLWTDYLITASSITNQCYRKRSIRNVRHLKEEWKSSIHFWGRLQLLTFTCKVTRGTFWGFHNLEWSQMMRFIMSIKKDKLHPYYPYFRFEQFSFCTLSHFPSRSFVQMLSWIKIRTLRLEVMHPSYLAGWPFWIGDKLPYKEAKKVWLKGRSVWAKGKAEVTPLGWKGEELRPWIKS